MGRRRKKHEEHTNHEAWAIPYGDLITLLLAFFVVMYAISSVNEGKYRVLSDSMVAAFRGSPKTLEPIQVGEKQSGSGAESHTTQIQQSMLQGHPRSMLTPIAIDTNLSKPQNTADTPSPYPNAREESLQEVADKVARAMDPLVKSNLVTVRHNKLWIEVEIRTDILFPSGSASLSGAAVPVIEELAKVLEPFPNAIRVEGHTDDRPINTIAFPSNWELSAARAASVVHLFARSGVNPSRLAVIGLGQFRPSKANDTTEGRNANRRVVIVILSADQPPPQDIAAPRADAADAGTANESAALAPAAPAQIVAPPDSAPQTMPVQTAPQSAVPKQTAAPPSGAPAQAAPQSTSTQQPTQVHGLAETQASAQGAPDLGSQSTVASQAPPAVAQTSGINSAP
jgi:chemotaxis protein MotB